MLLRQVTWGDALWVESAKSAGGFKTVHEAITRIMGRHVGSRNTFAKLTEVTDPADLSEVDAWRAWLLLTTLGLDPAEWGVADTVVPSYIDCQELKRRLVGSRLGESNPRPIHYWSPTAPRFAGIYLHRHPALLRLVGNTAA